MSNTKLKIMEAMYTLMAQKGYDKASIGQISEMICIKKPSVYYHFKSKEDILLELMNVYAKDVLSDFKDLFESKTKNEYIRAFLDYGNNVIMRTDVDFIRVNSEFYKLSNRLERVKNKIVKIESEYENAIRAAFWQGMSIGVYGENFDLEQAVQMFTVIMEGVNNVINFDMPIDIINVWSGFVNMITKS